MEDAERRGDLRGLAEEELAEKKAHFAAKVEAASGEEERRRLLEEQEREEKKIRKVMGLEREE